MEDERRLRYQIHQIVAKLQRKKHSMDGETLGYFINMTGGKNPAQFVADINQCGPWEAKHRDFKLSRVSSLGLVQTTLRAAISFRLVLM